MGRKTTTLKKAATAGVVGLAALGMTACKTKTTATKVSADQYVICEASGHCAGDEGPNPEKGIPKACLPQRRSIVRIERVHNGPVVVTCGPRLP